jgi:hypothetical protein
MNVLLMIWYGVNVEPVSMAVKSLQEAGCSVTTYGHLDKRLDPRQLAAHVCSISPDVILFWAMCFSQDHIALLKESVPRATTFALFNWDDPFSLRNNDNVVLAQAMDVIFTCSRAAQSVYTDMGISNYYLLPGCRQQSKFQMPEQYSCDVSFILTNLYEDPVAYPGQRFSRSDIIQALYDDNDIILHLYGPPQLGDRFPKSYQRHVDYDTSLEICHTSRVCISTHVVESAGYLNERSVIILGIGGVLLMDSAVNASEVPPDCFYVLEPTPRDIVQQIKRILLLSDDQIRTLRLNGFNYAQTNFLYSDWAHTLLKNISYHRQ